MTHIHFFLRRADSGGDAQDENPAEAHPHTNAGALGAIAAAGYNTFLLQNAQVFLDMLTDSGTNAMSDQQLAAMMVADDSYAGSQTFTRLEQVCRAIFEKEQFIPAHQGRACEHLLAQVLVKPGQLVPMNYHFTTTKAHIVRMGGIVVELPHAEALDPESTCPFKGNMDDAWRQCWRKRDRRAWRLCGWRRELT